MNLSDCFQAASEVGAALDENESGKDGMMQGLGVWKASRSWAP